MARRRFTIIFTILGFALFVSMAGFLLLYFVVGREPAVASNSTLVLKVGGDLAEVAPANVVGYLRGAKAVTVRGIVENLRKAKADARVSSPPAQTDRFRIPVLGQGPGNPRRGARLQEVRQAGVRVPSSTAETASTTWPARPIGSS